MHSLPFASSAPGGGSLSYRKFLSTSITLTVVFNLPALAIVQSPSAIPADSGAGVAVSCVVLGNSPITSPLHDIFFPLPSSLFPTGRMTPPRRKAIRLPLTARAKHAYKIACQQMSWCLETPLPPCPTIPCTALFCFVACFRSGFRIGGGGIG